MAETPGDQVSVGARARTLGAPAAIIGMVAVAFNLRIALASVPPVLPAIRHDLGIGHGAAGLLSTIPVACMGLLAPAAVWLGARLGVERVLLLSIVLVAGGTAARGLPGGAAALYLATLCVGAGIAVAGTLLSAFVKARFPRRAVMINGLYSGGLGLGAALAASGTVPLVHLAGGSWRLALTLWSVPAAAGALLWLILVGFRSRGEHILPPTTHVRLPWGSLLAWRVSIVFGLQSFLYYALLTWLPPLYIDAGWPATRAGLLLSVFSIVQIAGSLLVPLAAMRSPDRRPWIVGLSCLTAAGVVALAFVPLAAPWVCASALGFSAGGLFTLALTLPLDATDNPHAAARLIAMSMAIGYLLGAISPFVIGLARDATNSFRVSMIVVAVLALVLALVATGVRPQPHALP